MADLIPNVSEQKTSGKMDIVPPEKMPDLNRVVDSKELSGILRISEVTLRAAVQSGDIPKLNLPGRAVRFHLRTVYKALGAAV